MRSHPILMYFGIVIIFMVQIVSSCQSAPITFRPPDLNELQAFTKDQGITPIVDHLLGDSTVLLYKNGASFGYYILTVQEPDDTVIASHNVSTAKSDQPILIIRQLTGNPAFIAVVIQDQLLLSETIAIEFTIDPQNRLTATTNGQEGAIIVSPSLVNDWKTVTLYNAQGRVLYSQENHE